jgi:hypothetical protein
MDKCTHRMINTNIVADGTTSEKMVKSSGGAFLQKIYLEDRLDTRLIVGKKRLARCPTRPRTAPERRNTDTGQLVKVDLSKATVQH